MADLRYLKQRHQSWYFSLAVPVTVRGRFLSTGRNGHGGKPLTRIVTSLGTQSLKEAQDRRWPLVHEWRERFKRVMANVPLTVAEIEAEARELYYYLLDWMEQHKKTDRDEEAATINAKDRIRPAKHTFKTALAWIPLIGLFSGLRSNEICQLRKSDVQRKNGVWIFNVSTDHEGQSLKTEAATRIVPVHSELIACGFLDYVKALPDGQLFPALKPGGADGKMNYYFSKRFPDFRRRCGVSRPRTAFHSFRKNVAQALKDEGNI